MQKAEDLKGCSREKVYILGNPLESMDVALADRVQQLFRKHHDTAHGVINVAGVMDELGQEAPSGVSPTGYITSTFRAILESTAYAHFHGAAQTALCGQISQGYVTDPEVFALTWDYGQRMTGIDWDIPARTLNALVRCQAGRDWLQEQIVTWTGQSEMMNEWHDYARQLIERQKHIMERPHE